MGFNSGLKGLTLSNCHKAVLEMEFVGLPILKLDSILRQVIGRTRQTGEMATSKQWTSNWVGHSAVLTNCQIKSRPLWPQRKKPVPIE
jgi:hypothetical protein